MNTSAISTDNLMDFLREVNDPEIPVLNIVEMGIVREIEISDSGIVVKITPTYSGCPAMKAIEDEIVASLKEKNIENVIVQKVYKPAWSTSMLSGEAKVKLKKYGIAPPGNVNEEDFYMNKISRPVECPYCSSKNTKLTSEFGSTACKAFHFCNECSQPFEHFKCI